MQVQWGQAKPSFEKKMKLNFSYLIRMGDVASGRQRKDGRAALGSDLI